MCSYFSPSYRQKRQTPPPFFQFECFSLCENWTVTSQINLLNEKKKEASEGSWRKNSLHCGCLQGVAYELSRNSIISFFFSGVLDIIGCREYTFNILCNPGFLWSAGIWTFIWFVLAFSWNFSKYGQFFQICSVCQTFRS